jgi:hypothetical protein
MAKGFGKKTRISNTGSDSQNGFSIGPDWFTLLFTKIETGQELRDILKSLESLAGDQIDFAADRPRLDNHKSWSGSGRSEKGILLWYNPPRSGADPLTKSLDGNLITHPGLLPAPHHPITEQAADYIRSRLPEYAELKHDPTPVTVYDPLDGSAYPHHGYSIEPSAQAAIETPGELRASMSARYLANVDMRELAAWLSTIKDVYCVRCTRMDIALDDHEKRIPLSLVEKARSDRNFFNVRRTSVVLSDDLDADEQGQTIYFGSRQSEAFMRIYDKFIESKGAVAGNRWETEFHGEKANKCLADWLTAMETNEAIANNLLKDLVLGTVDFRDKSLGDKNRARCPLLPWFENFCEMLAAVPLRLRIARPKQSMQKTIDYLKKSVAPSIASLSKVLGGKFDWFMSDLIKDGEARMTKQRRKMIAATDPTQLCY